MRPLYSEARKISVPRWQFGIHDASKSLSQAGPSASNDLIRACQSGKLIWETNQMPSFLSSSMSVSQFAAVLKMGLSLQRFMVLFTRASAERGRERYRRAGMTASTAYIAKGITVPAGFVSVPLTVHYLGAERYGVWLTISSLLLWIALTDFGLAGNALVNVVSEAAGNDDVASARHYAASGAMAGSW